MSTLPEYPGPSPSPPGYSSIPLEDEQTLAHTPRRGHDRSGTYVRNFKNMTIILKGQDEDNRLPTYTRGAIIHGEIGLNHTENIVEISIKLYGQMFLMAAEYGSAGAKMISEKYTLWNSDAARSDDKKCPKCPSVLPFRIPFPITYCAPNGKATKLPPSFETAFSSIPAMFAKCIYSLSITIVKTRLASWNASKTFSININYRPRTRPHRPIVMVGSIFSSLKPVPEEWRQVMFTMETRLGSSATPIECHLLIPSVQTFAITDPIPFHLQLCSSRESLHQLIPPDSHLLDPAEWRRNSLPTNGILVYLVRHVLIEIAGRRKVRPMTIGTSHMCPMPPTVTEVYSPDEIPIRLDWQGEVKCWEGVTCGGFNSGALSVKDFLVVILSPTSKRSPLLPIQVTHPIRLVTDSWIDLDEPSP